MASKKDLEHEDAVSTEELWSRWQEAGENEVKMLLVERYQPLVGFIAAKIASSLPRSIDVNDLIQEGTPSFRALSRIDRGKKSRRRISSRIAPRMRW